MEQLKDLNKPAESVIVPVTSGDIEADHAKTSTEIATHNDQVAKQKKRTYLTSEIPVRPCTADCPHRETCKDFLSGRVVNNDLCKPQLRQIKKWQVAFKNGDVNALKEDAGSVAGTLAVQIFALMEKVIADGVVVEVEKYDQLGHRYTELATHPALTSAMNLLKTLGLDLNSFLMTPKATKDAPPPVQVNIGVTAERVNQKFAARFGPRKPVDSS